MALRILFCTVVVACLVGSPAALHSQDQPADFVSLAEIELPFETTAQFDGAGALRVVHDGQALLEIELMFAGGFVDDPTNVRLIGLAATAGAQVLMPEVVARTLREGIAGGQRGTLADDDGDGSLDEDPVDGLDNDGDGAIDEDFAAIGTTMHAARANLDALGLAGVSLHSEIFHWGYYHVDGTLFWKAQLESEPVRARTLTGAPAALLRSDHEIELIDRRIHPHLSVGRAPEVRLTFPRVRTRFEDGSALYVGLLRLDGRRAAMLPPDETHVDPGVVWEAGAANHWPLAVLVARTESSLLYLAGQALLTFDRAGETREPAQRWSVPPLCEHCRNPQVAEAKARLSVHDETLRLRMSYVDTIEPEMIDHEGLKLAGLPMAPWLEHADPTSAVYELPLGSATARHLIEAGQTGGLRPSVWITAGKAVQPRVFEVELARELEEVPAEIAVATEVDLPSYLSPRLVQSWPNPFRENTTIEVHVPATVEEAFDLEPSLRSRVDLQAPPPFGTQPTVQVRVYNVGGQLIQSLDESVRGPGSFSVTWDGNDLSGRSVAAGAYYVNVEIGDWSVTRRVLRLKP